MKKRILPLALAFIMLFSSLAIAARQVKITLNGTEVKTDVEPVLKDNRTLVPVRFISEALGYKVEWNEAKREVAVEKGSDKLLLTIGNKKSLLNGVEKENDVAPQIMNNRTFVPLRFIAENFLVKVEWDDKTSTVILTTENPVNISGVLGNVDLSNLTEAEKEYVNNFVKSQQRLIGKLAEFKKYAFEDFNKYSKSELLVNFNRLTTESLDVIADTREIVVPEKFKVSNDFYRKVMDRVSPMLDKFKMAFLGDDSQSAVLLVEELAKFSMDATEAIESLKAEIKGVPYVPQADIETYKKTQDERNKLLNTFIDKL